MQGYILSVAAAASLGVFCDVILPQKWKKYAGILTGAILLLTLIAPCIKFKNINFFIPELPDMEYTSYDMEAEIEQNLKTRIETDICQRLKSEFNINCTAEAEIGVTNDKISGVEKITLSCRKNDAVLARISEVYGCKEVIFESG